MTTRAVPPDLLNDPAVQQLWRLLATGVSVERATAIGTYRGTWTARDVAAVAARLNPRGKKPPTPHPNCGTRKGYRRHQRDREYACRPCTDAHSAYNREYRAQFGKAS